MKTVLKDIKDEVNRAKKLHPGEFHNAHEGYAVLLEEVRELENAVFFGKKKCGGNPILHQQMMREEAIQIAAMAVRFANELCTT